MSAVSTSPAGRPEVSVYWQPGCSSCLKTKEFVEEQGIDFESVNVLEQEEAMEEILASGLRSIPAVRKGGQFIYAQNLDDVARLLGVTRNHRRLSHAALFDRWDQILGKVEAIAAKFNEEQLNERVIPMRNRSVGALAVHVGQIVHAFILQLDEGLTDIKPVHAEIPAHIDVKKKSDILAHLAEKHAAIRAWRQKNGENSIPAQIETYYGLQPASQVVERAVWHCTQHARQLDTVAAGRLGAELEIPADLYAGLPLPKRLWA